MNKLREVIQEYGRWADLSIFAEKIETHIEIDFSNSLENAKTLLESIGKEICIYNGMDLGESLSVNAVLKKTFSSIDYSNSNLVTQISSALATIGQQVGELRNEIGLTSHGKSLKEIRKRNNKVNILTREFLIDTVEIVSVFLIRNFKTKNARVSNQPLEDTLDYFEAEDFNEFWDESFGEFTMGKYSYTASEILFNIDKQAYVTEYKAFIEDE